MYLDPETREPLEPLPDTLTITLDPPLVYGQATIAELVLREPNLSNVAKAHGKLDHPMMPSPGAEREYKLTFISEVTGKPREAMSDLRASTIRQAVDYLEAFVACRLDEPKPDGEDLVLEFDPPLRDKVGTVDSITLTEPTGRALLEAEKLLGAQPSPLPGALRRYQSKLIELCGKASPMVAGQVPFRQARLALMFLENFERSAPATQTTSPTG